MRFAILLAACTLATTRSAEAFQLITPVSQDRYVSGSADADDFVTFLSDDDSEAAVDFSPFIGAAAASLNHSDFFAQAGGTQDSEIGGSSISATGSHFANSEVYESPWLAESLGISEMTVTFDLTAPSSFSLTGMVSSNDFGISDVSLRDSSNTYLGGSTSIGNESFPVNDQGFLASGQYTLRARTHGDTVTNSFGFDYASGNFEVDLSLNQIAGNYCSTAPNSVGPGAQISFSGTPSIAANDFTLQSTGSPGGVMGLYYYGPAQIDLPFGDGHRCVGGSIHRLGPPVAADGAGNASRLLDFTSGSPASGPGAITATSTWNFQWWYRDGSGPGGNGFNLSDGLWVTFAP